MGTHRFVSIVLAATSIAANVSAAAEPGPFAVAADHALAERAGIAVLERGGNAVDAAVATSFALAVVRPESCGIGGGGFMVIHLVDDPRTEAEGDAIDIALDYRERAPAAITPTTFVDLPPEASITTGLAVAVPGTVAGLLRAHEMFGVLSRAEVIAPAIALARSGYALDAHAGEAAEVLREAITSPGIGFQERFFMAQFVPEDPAHPEDKRPHLAELAETLDLIATGGRDAFYTGAIAQAIVDTVKARGGVMTMEDLAGYHPVEAVPLRVKALDKTFLAMPLPSSGGVAVLQCIRTIEERRDLLANVKFGMPKYLHLVSESLKLAFADRARFLADPECTDARAEPMLDPARIRSRAYKIRNDSPLSIDDPAVMAPLPDDAGTSHLCVVDAAGNAVACTETVNLLYGSCIPVVRYGFFLNNEMDDFLTKPGRANAFALTQAEANLPGPGKRPLSSMSPTIVLDHRGDVEVVAGASGGPRIISATLQVVLGVVMFQMDAQDAVDAPRIHHQWQPDVMEVEASPAMVADAIRALRDRKNTVEVTERGAAVQCIARDPANPKLWHSAHDKRKRVDPAAPSR